jgi:hydrocephalus-inducing protein
MGIGIYVEEDNRFIFNNVIVSRTAKARFKLINTNKIPIDLNILLKQGQKTLKATNNDSPFEIEPNRVQLSPHSHAYVTVSFTPLVMINYSTIFEANLENVPSSTKNRSISFEISGDGNLPNFRIIKPILRNKKSQTLLLFKRSVINHIDYQQLILANNGTLPTKLNFFMHDPDNAFKIRPTPTSNNNKFNGIIYNNNSQLDSDIINSIIIQPQEQINLTVSCLPTKIQTYQASLQVIVVDNHYEETLIQMIGEGYMENVTLENMHSFTNMSTPDDIDENIIGDEEVSALRCNSISFGDVYVNEEKQLLFTMKNQSKTDCFRFEWPITHPSSASEQPTAIKVKFINILDLDFEFLDKKRNLKIKETYHWIENINLYTMDSIVKLQLIKLIHLRRKISDLHFFRTFSR